MWSSVAKTALIVEDEIFIALDLERILTDAGYEVAAIAADAADALHAAPQCDFAFVDINLRDGATGPQIAQRLTHDHQVAVVFVTANPEQIAGNCDAIAYVRKPFDDASICAAAALASDEPGSTTDMVVRAIGPRCE